MPKFRPNRLKFSIFSSSKLEMIPAGADNSSEAIYRFYYWMTALEPHFMVKYENGIGNLWELVKFE